MTVAGDVTAFGGGGFRVGRDLDTAAGNAFRVGRQRGVGVRRHTGSGPATLAMTVGGNLDTSQGGTVQVGGDFRNLTVNGVIRGSGAADVVPSASS